MSSVGENLPQCSRPPAWKGSPCLTGVAGEEEEDDGRDGGEDGRGKPGDDNDGHTLQVGEARLALGPHDRVPAWVGDKGQQVCWRQRVWGWGTWPSCCARTSGDNGEADDGADNGVGGGHGQLQVGGEEEPNATRQQRAQHAVHEEVGLVNVLRVRGQDGGDQARFNESAAKAGRRAGRVA